ncbi:unnamed protein product [Phytomonas sp. EM1]|nr:unnamed protein product [Phytomonas sp. EM1]|eukprot:CCW64391.1 unnamed protein product [Phytomonas sp. isolate EM1]
MPISVVRAIKIIDQHLSAKKRLDDNTARNESSQLPPVENVRVKGAICARNSREMEPRLTLPAFCVEWQGGPSPIASNQSSSKRSAAEILRFRRDRSDQADAQDDADFEFPSHSGGTSSQSPSNDLVVKASDNLSGSQKSKALIDKNRLCQKCVQHYPRGALGLRESPYGDPGFVYTALSRHYMKESRRIRGYTDYIPVDHLRGGVLLPEQPRQGVIAEHVSRLPLDHMLGGVILPDA